MNLKRLFLPLTITLLLASCGDSKNETPEPPKPPQSEQPDSSIDIFDVPDKDGFNIKGVVYCDGKPVENVVVSDGASVVKTNTEGRYYLQSDKKRDYVFVSIPTGYRVKSDRIYPQHYSKFNSADASIKEQHNFELVKNENTDYIILGLADMHVANVRNTPKQFTERFIPDVNATIAEYKSRGKEVYCISLGDNSHDLYWYTYNLALGATKPYLEKINAPIFQCMGNHDNDPYCADDFLAENTWRKEMGPSYYSFNLGQIHYVVLDNIIYQNNGGTQGSIGDRSYDLRITTEQLEWLKKDLDAVAKSTPLVIAMHASYFNKAKLYDKDPDPQKPRIRYTLENYKDLKALIAGFTNVTILSGHAHINSSTGEDNIREYNIGAVNGSLWYTGQDHMAKNHICGDGSVGGYFVMDVKDKTYTHYYKSMGYDRNYQFRTYDGNKTFIRKSKHFPSSSYSNKKVYELFNNTANDPSNGNYGCMEEWGGVYKDGASSPVARTDNMVFINVFGWDDRWKIEVTENGKKLDVTRMNAYDPLHIISLACKCLENGADKNKEESITSGRLPSLTSHFFRVHASSATSTLTITVTDADNVVYTEEMTRPKEFSTDMK